jgi:hypothetical protein
MNNLKKAILLFFAISVLVSYYIVFKILYKKSNKSYIDHDFWFGLDKNLVKIIIVFQLIALIGFITSVGYWMNNSPQGGIMSKGDVLFYTLLAFFIGSIIWPFAVYYKKHIIVVLSLIIVAISSILLLAGSVEEKNVKVNVVIGFLFLCIVTVLLDAVVWNANYITKINM